MAAKMSKKVLIVEDNELNMKLFRDLLEAHGISSVTTSNGHEVLELARKENPDLGRLQLRWSPSVQVFRKSTSDRYTQEQPCGRWRIFRFVDHGLAADS